MRPIHLAKLDKARPVVILTREAVRPYRTVLTVAPITSTVRGLATEVAVGRENGLDHDSVVACDNITTVPAAAIGPHLGYLRDTQERALAEAMVMAFGLDLY